MTTEENPPQPERIPRSLRAALLFVILGVYLGLCLTGLQHPGLDYDETLFGDAALGIRESLFVPYEWTIGGLRVPVMLMTYIGAVRAWLDAPVFAVFGVSPWSVRIPMITLGAVTLLCTERIVRSMFSARAALLATALLAIDPSFVFGTREDYGFISIMFATKTASMVFLIRFAGSRRAGDLFAAFFLMGLGLFDKFNFAWHIGAISVASVMVWPSIRPFLTRRNVLVAGAGFVTGCWPLLVYNVVRHGATWAGVKSDGLFGAALEARFAALRAVLEGTAFPAHSLGEAPGSPGLLPWVIALTVPAAVVARRYIPLRWFGFCWLVVLSTIGAIIVTPKATGGHHAMMLWPFWHVIIAATAVGFADWARARTGRPAVARFLGPMALTALAFSSLSLDIRTLSAYLTTGGHWIFSDGIYELSASMSSDPTHRYLLMDWGMGNQVSLLSRGTVRQEEPFWSLNEPGRTEEQIQYLHARAHEPETLFVFNAPAAPVFAQPRHLFELMLDKYGMVEEIVRMVRERDGREAYRIVRAVPDTGAVRTRPMSASTERGWLRAERLPGECKDGNAVFQLSWGAPEAAQTEIHVSTPDGPLFARSGTTGSATTGQWVTSGMVFYLQNTAAGGVGSTLVKLEVKVDCP